MGIREPCLQLDLKYTKILGHTAQKRNVELSGLHNGSRGAVASSAGQEIGGG